MRCHTQFLGRKQKRAWSKKPYSYIYAAEPLDSLFQILPKGAISLEAPKDVNGPTERADLLTPVDSTEEGRCHLPDQQPSARILSRSHTLNNACNKATESINHPFHLILLITHRPSNGAGRQRGDQRELLTVFCTPYISMNHETCVIFDEFNIPYEKYTS